MRVEPVITWCSKSGGRKFPIVDGHHFMVNGKTTTTKLYWKCKKLSCPVTLITSGDEIHRIKNDHNHLIDEEIVSKHLYKAKAVELINENPFKGGKSIYDAMVSSIVNLDSQSMSDIPGYNSLSTSIYRIKNQHNPATPRNIFNFILDDRYRVGLTNKNFLICDDNTDGRLLIFGDLDFARNIMRGGNYDISMDGTFKSTPEIFYQIYIIYITYSGQSFSLFYAFLERKTYEIYNNMIRQINLFLEQNGMILRPKKIIIDFEYAMFKVLSENFVCSKIKGCYFHFAQAIRRQMDKLSLRNLYNNSDAFQRICKLILALPFSPMERVNEAWNSIKSIEIEHNDSVDKFFHYIERTWIIASNPLFNRDIWSHFDNSDSRTNNFAEGFNSKLNKKVNKVNPNFYEVLTIIQEIQNNSEIELTRLIRGGSPKSRKKIFSY